MTGPTLYSEGEWHIDEVPDARSWDSWIRHACKRARAAYLPNGAYVGVPGHRCCVCKARSPDSVIALWTLHNYDRIQTNGWYWE